jgi:biopolymer transport protein ExbB
METSSFSVLELFKLGGAFMWPLLFFSVVAVAISLECAIYLLYHNLRVDDLAVKGSIFFVKKTRLQWNRQLSFQVERQANGARILLSLLRHSRLRSGFSEHRAERARKLKR